MAGQSSNTGGNDSFSLYEGLRVSVQIDTDAGRVSLRGAVTYVASHHLRVRTENRLRPGEASADDTVKMRPLTDKGMLPLTTKFVRIDTSDPDVIILRIPTGMWQRNRRAFARAPVELPIGVFRRNGAHTSGSTINLSGSGVFVEAEMVVGVGEDVLLWLDVPKDNGGPIAVVARVVRLQEFKEKRHFAATFVDIGTRKQNRLCRLIIVNELEVRRAAMRELTGR